MAKDCGRCGFPTSAGMRVRSKATGQFYCGDLEQCSRRAANLLTFEEIGGLIRGVERELRR